MSNTFDFIGFDGVERSFPSLIDAVNNYKHFMVFKHPSYDAFSLVFFNSTNFSCSITTQFGSRCYTFNFYDDDVLLCASFLPYAGYTDWSEFTQLNSSNFNVQYGNLLLYTSDSLSSYKDIIGTFDFSLDIPEEEFNEELSSYTLRPIVEEQNISSLDIFGEVFGILPVLLVVLISFIGIRKSISFLSNLLRRS